MVTLSTFVITELILLGFGSHRRMVDANPSRELLIQRTISGIDWYKLFPVVAAL
jgi:hypothetical protein